MVRRTALIALLLLLLFISSTSLLAQSEDDSWVVQDMTLLSDLIPGDYSLANAFLSPDGSRVAWTEDAETLCFYLFSDEEIVCDSVPPEFRLQTNVYSVPAWSSDGSTIAFHDDFFINLRDSDIWFYDVEGEVFRNVTNDGYLGRVGFDEEESPPVDYAPVWNPVDGDLYFFRSVRLEDNDGESDYTTELHRVGTEGRVPELVRDMTDFIPRLSVYVPPAFSADGTRLAFVVAPVNLDEDRRTGVWIYNLEDDSLEQVAALADLQQGLPSIDMPPKMPFDIRWVGDTNALIVRTEDRFRMAAGPMQNAYYIDLATGDVTPLVDLSDVEDQESFLDIGGEGDAPVFKVPFLGVVAPDGSAYWGLNVDFRDNQDREGGISVYPLPPDGTVDVVHREPGFRPAPRQDLPPGVSRDGKALFYGWLVTFAQE